MRCTDRKDERTDVATRSHGTSANPSGEPWRGAHPLVWISVIGFLIAFVWEMLQLPFYEAGGLTPAQAAYRCGLASLGDAGIMVAAYLVGSIGNSYSPWLVRWPAGRFSAYLATGLVITASVEVLAVGADWGWTYSDLMPLLPGTHIGLVPMLMWVIVPTATLWLVRRIGVGPKERLPNN